MQSQEADRLMMLHVAHDAQHDSHQILVHTVDIDVVVLGELVAAALPAGMEVWLAFGVGKHFQSLAAYQAPACLESVRSFTLIGVGAGWVGAVLTTPLFVNVNRIHITGGRS